MNLREAAGQALEALLIWQDSLTNPSAIPGWRFSVVGEKAITALRAALAEPEPRNQCGEICERAKLCAVCARGIADGNKDQDWDEIEALRASLREHMAEIHRLRTAGRQALDAMDYTRWAVADYAQKWGIPRHDAAMNTLRAALTEDRSADTGETLNIELPPLPSPDYYDPYDDETPFFSEEQMQKYAVAAIRKSHIADSSKMMATSQESRQVEPVVEFRGRRNTPEKTSECWGILLCDFMQDPPKGTKLYTAPPKRKPLTEEQICEIFISHGRDKETFARAIERAHGIGGEE